MKSVTVSTCILLLIGLVVVSCTPPTPGPDKRLVGTVEGAAAGAGAGAVTGFQVSAATGPGAAIGAGVGAAIGGIEGMVLDDQEEDLLAIAAQSREERIEAVAKETLADQFKRRVELHPTREIYPADLFFAGDESRITPKGYAVVRELAKLNKSRLPWSRIVIACYVKSSDSESKYAQYLGDKRSRAIGDVMVREGLEPRRIEAKGVAIDAPILIDPNDAPERYNQAIEIIPIDR